MKPLHNACYNGLHSLKRTCDKDKTGNLLSRLTSCRAKDPEQFKEIGLATVDKQKHARRTMQREMVVSMLESTTSSLTVEQTFSILFALMYHDNLAILEQRVIVTCNVLFHFLRFDGFEIVESRACVHL